MRRPSTPRRPTGSCPTSTIGGCRRSGHRSRATRRFSPGRRATRASRRPPRCVSGRSRPASSCRFATSPRRRRWSRRSSVRSTTSRFPTMRFRTIARRLAPGGRRPTRSRTGTRSAPSAAWRSAPRRSSCQSRSDRRPAPTPSRPTRACICRASRPITCWPCVWPAGARTATAICNAHSISAEARGISTHSTSAARRSACCAAFRSTPSPARASP